ncbi:hypothetical protein Tco_0298057 [Tanacetum coccineum]
MATCHHLSGATWHFHCSPPPVNLWSTAAGPQVNGGQRRWSTAVNTARPPVNDDGQRRSTVAVGGGQRRRSTTAVNTARPPVNDDGQRWRTTVDHRRTTAGPPVNGGRPPVKAGSGSGLGRVWARSGSGLDRVWAGSSSSPGREGNKSLTRIELETS